MAEGLARALFIHRRLDARDFRLEFPLQRALALALNSRPTPIFGQSKNRVPDQSTSTRWVLSLVKWGIAQTIRRPENDNNSLSLFILEHTLDHFTLEVHYPVVLLFSNGRLAELVSWFLILSVKAFGSLQTMAKASGSFLDDPKHPRCLATAAKMSSSFLEASWSSY